MKKILVKNGFVDNICEAEADFVSPDHDATIDWVEDAQIGYAVENGSVILPVPKTAEELEAERLLKIEAENIRQSNRLSDGRSIIRALGVEVFKLAKAAEPTLTAQQFKERIKTSLDSF